MTSIEKLPGIEHNVPLAPLTTMKIGGPAKFLVKVETSQGLQKAVQAAKEHDVPFFVLGGGSNTLISDKGFDGLVIKANGGNHAISGTKLCADSSAVLAAISRIAYQHGLAGMEWGIGIPGTIGGAVRGNAGNFLGDTQSVVYAVDILDETGAERTLTKDECAFAYRHSIFKKRKDWIILRAHFALTRDEGERIKERMDEILAYKQKTQNTPYPTSGCMFKNIRMESPQDRANAELNGISNLVCYSDDIGCDVLPIRALLEQLKLEGFAVGGAQISETNANFILNKNNATAEDVMMLVGIIKQKIKETFGFDVVDEFQHVGFDR